MTKLDIYLPAVLPPLAEDHDMALSQAQPQAKHEEQKDWRFQNEPDMIMPSNIN